MIGAIFWGSTATSHYTCSIETCTLLADISTSYTITCGVLVEQRHELATMSVGNYWTRDIADIMLRNVYKNGTQVRCHSGGTHDMSDYFDSTRSDFKNYSLSLAGKVMVTVPQIVLVLFFISVVIWRRVLRSNIKTRFVSLNDEKQPLNPK